MDYNSGHIVIVDTYNDFHDWLNNLGVDPKDTNISSEQFNEKYALIEFPKIKGIFLDNELSPHKLFSRQLLYSPFAFWYMDSSTKLNNNKRFNGKPVMKPYNKSQTLFECDIKLKLLLDIDNLYIREWVVLTDYNTQEPKKLYDYYKKLCDNPSLELYGYDKITNTFASFEKKNDSRSPNKQPTALNNYNKTKYVSFFNDFPESKTNRFPGIIVKNSKYYFVHATKSFVLTSQWVMENQGDSLYSERNNK